ncbi:MAG: MDR family MFS transporter [Bacillaceae bacterium]
MERNDFMTALKKLHPIVWTIVIGTMFGRLATSMSMPFLTIYLTKTLGASPFQAAFIVGLTALVGIFMSFVGGNLSDRFGRKMIMLFSIFFFTIVFVGYSYANEIWMFFFLAGLNGVARSLFEPASRALLGDVTPREHKLMVYNLRYGAINLGVAVGPLLGVIIGSAQSTKGFLLPALIYFIYGIVLFFMLKKVKVQLTTIGEKAVNMVEAMKVVKKDHVFLLSISAMILCSIAYSQFMSTMPQYFGNSPDIKNGVTLYAWLITLNAVTVVVLQYPLTRIGKKYSSLTSITIGGVIISISLMLLGIAHSVPTLIGCMILFTIGEVLMFSMTDVFVDEIAPTHLRGTYFGAMGLNGIGQVCGPWLGGAILSYYGYADGGITFFIIGCISILSLPLFIIIRHKLKSQAIYQSGNGVNK